MIVFKIVTKMIVFIVLWMQTDNIIARAVIAFYFFYTIVFEGLCLSGEIPVWGTRFYFYSEVLLVLVLSIWFSDWPYLTLFMVLIGSTMLIFNDRKERWWLFVAVLLINFLLLIRFEWITGHFLWDRVLSDFSISIFAAVTFGVIALLNDRQTELKHLNRKLEEYANQIEELAMTKERNRMAREIHDTVAHGMTGLIMQLQAARKVNRRDPDKADQLLERSEDATREVLREMRQSVSALAPENTRSLTGTEALRELIEAFSHSTGMEINFNVHGERHEPDAERQIVLYRVLQETLTNAKRHGEAVKVGVKLIYDNAEILLVVHDNGKGFTKLNEGFGISGMKSRLQEVNGELAIQSDPGNGCEVRMTIPYDASHA